MGIMVYIVVCAIAFLLIYAIDLFLVNYHMTSRKEFGETPVKVDPLQYFVDNIPNVLGYTDHTLEYGVTCFEVMSYEETDTQESFRCCDAGDGSLVSRVFFQAVDENCIISLWTILGVPATLDDTYEYLTYGSCPEIRFGELTVVQLDNHEQIQWKYVKVRQLRILTSVLCCVVGPLLLLLAIWSRYSMIRSKKGAAN